MAEPDPRLLALIGDSEEEEYVEEDDAEEVPEPPPVAAPPAPPKQRSVFEAFLDRGRGVGEMVKNAPSLAWSAVSGVPNAVGQTLAHPIDTTVDALRGFGRGASFEYMDEGASRLLGNAGTDDGTGIPREYAAGSAQADMQAQIRRDNAEAQARSPYATFLGQAGGMAPATAVASVLSPVAAVVGGGALMAHGASEQTDPNEIAADTLTGGTLGGALALASKYAPKVTGRTPERLAARSAEHGVKAAAMRRAANKSRARDMGALQGEMRTLERTPTGEAFEQVSKYPDDAANQILAGGTDRYIEPARKWGVRTPDEIARKRADLEAGLVGTNQEIAGSGAGVLESRIEQRIRAMAADERALKSHAVADQLDAMADDFARQGPTSRTREIPPAEPESLVTETVEYPIESFTQTMKPNTRRGAGGRIERGGDPVAIPVDVVEPVELTRFVKNEPTRVVEPVPEPASGWDKMLKVRSRFGEGTNFASDAPIQKARSRVYGIISEEMENAAETARPGAGKQWRAANEDVHVARKLTPAAQRSERAGASNLPFGLVDTGSILGGAVTGAVTGLQTGTPGIGAMIGAGAAFAGKRAANSPRVAEAVFLTREQLANRAMRRLAEQATQPPRGPSPMAALAASRSATGTAPAAAAPPAQPQPQPEQERAPALTPDEAIAQLEADNMAFGPASEAVFRAALMNDQDALDEALSQVR